MNILPHKSWHVRTKKNIERVRRDEARAEAEENEKQRRIQLAEQEARTELLRRRARESLKSNVTETVFTGLNDEHVNIFDSVDEKIDAKNEEHEREVKEERERWEKRIGLLTYLDQGEAKSGQKPWYLQSHEERMNLNDDKKDNKELVKKKDFIKMNDPFEDMKRYLDAMKKNKGERSNAKLNPNQSKNKRKKKDKKKNKKPRKHLSSSSSSSSSSEDEQPKKHKSKSIEQLRAERLNREKIERERTKQFLQNKQQSSQNNDQEDDRRRNYHSQFNPQLARHN